MNTNITPKTLRSTLVVGALVMLIVFTLFELRFYLSGPKITIQSQYYKVDEPYIDMTFKVSNTKELLIQGVPVVPQVSGLVTQRVFVQTGLNTVMIQATDRYGAQNKQKIHVFYPQVLEKQD